MDFLYFFFISEESDECRLNGPWIACLEYFGCYQTGIICEASQRDCCQVTVVGARARKGEGVLSYSSSSMAVGSWTERHLTMECSTGVFLWSETFNAVLTSPSFSVPRSSSHCKEWLFSSHLISHGFRLAPGAAFPFSLAFRFGECWGFLQLMCVTGPRTVPRPPVESTLWPKWAATLQDSWTAVILGPESCRSFSWGKMPVWRHGNGYYHSCQTELTAILRL